MSGTPTGETDDGTDRPDHLGGLPVSDALGALSAGTAGPGACEACGSPHARPWSTPEGPARLCPPCATLHGIGCP